MYVRRRGGDAPEIPCPRPQPTVRSVQPFLTGFLQNNNWIGRPVDVEVMRDGSLLVSDDYAGSVYRISYGAPRTASR